MDKEIKIIVVDLFCGAGGTTQGFEKCKQVKVIACINHDNNAIASHEANHPNCEHFVEDVRHFNVHRLIPIIDSAKIRYPNAKFVLWASAECTNHSNAKGGKSRDADSRSLPNDLIRYLEILNPDFFQCENVQEFMAWGELDSQGKPISRKNGLLYQHWVNNIKKLGFDYEWKILNAADFGAVQNRERWFGFFAKKGLPIVFPKPTHRKKVEKKQETLFELETLKPHRAVKEVLDLNKIGTSIFLPRKNGKYLVDRTLIRLLKGLKKFESEKMIMVNKTPGYCRTIDNPNPTVTCKDTSYLVQPIAQFIDRGYTGGGNFTFVNESIGTITTFDDCRLATAKWIDYQFSNGGQNSSIDAPVGALTTVPKSQLATAYVYNPQYKNLGSSIEKPCCTVIASQAKAPLGLTVFTYGNKPNHLLPLDIDTDVMLELKQYCRENGIEDVFLRMLMEKELLQIQGFPIDYKLIGTKKDRHKFIGNAVEVNQAYCIAVAYCAVL